MSSLEKLYKKCKTVKDVGDLLHKTHFFKRALEFARARLDELREETEQNSTPFLPNAEEMYDLKESNRKMHRKFGTWERDVELKMKPFPFVGLDMILPVLLEILQDVFEKLSEGSDENDLIRIVLQSSQIDRPISMKTARKAEFNLEMFFNELVKVLNSYQEFRLDQPIQINVKRIMAGPKAGGRPSKLRNEILLERILSAKRCIISVSADGLCFGRALAIAKALADGVNITHPRYWATLRQKRTKGVQFKEASALYEQAQVLPGPVPISQTEKFQKILPDYQITVYNTPAENATIFRGPEREKKINLLLHEDHFSVITKLAPFFGKRKQCPDCKRYVDKLGRFHRCTGECFVCQRKDCPQQESFYCHKCNSVFRNRHCFDRHLERLINPKPKELSARPFSFAETVKCTLTSSDLGKPKSTSATKRSVAIVGSLSHRNICVISNVTKSRPRIVERCFSAISNVQLMANTYLLLPWL